MTIPLVLKDTDLAARAALGIKVVKLVEKWEQRGLCILKTMNGTYRCNQGICDCANGLWPGMDAMEPLMSDTTDHAGVFLVAENAVEEYVQRINPQILRDSKRAKSYGCEAMNFGIPKGLQFERVLIVPTGPIKKYLETSDLTHLKEKSKHKLHVAVTRARHSVAFVFDGQSPIVPARFL